MRTLTRSWMLALGLALATAGGVVVHTPATEAQGLEYCRDLGVMVQHVPQGMAVVSLRGGGVARQLGLRRGDIIWGVDGSHPNSLDELHSMLFSGADGAMHDLDVFRGAMHLHTGVFHMNGLILTRGTLR